jgi:hypothetical protein
MVELSAWQNWAPVAFRDFNKARNVWTQGSCGTFVASRAVSGSEIQLVLPPCGASKPGGTRMSWQSNAVHPQYKCYTQRQLDRVYTVHALCEGHPGPQGRRLSKFWCVCDAVSSGPLCVLQSIVQPGSLVQWLRLPWFLVELERMASACAGVILVVL